MSYCGYVSAEHKDLMHKNVQPELKVNDVVIVSIPEADRTAMSPINLPCRIMSSPRKGYYVLGCAAGILQPLYRESVLTLETNATFPELSEIPEVEVSMRTAVANVYRAPISQRTCNCKGLCTTKKCSCRRLLNVCNSKCHKEKG